MRVEQDRADHEIIDVRFVAGAYAPLPAVPDVEIDGGAENAIWIVVAQGSGRIRRTGYVPSGPSLPVSIPAGLAASAASRPRSSASRQPTISASGHVGAVPAPALKTKPGP